VIRALLLDFDGLLYDTESSAYGAWETVFAEHGVHLSLRTWVGEVIGRSPGSSSFDPISELERLSGHRVDRHAVLADRDARRQAMLPHKLMPGADALLAGAEAAGIKTAIVTSNSLVNVEGHLARADNTHRFDAIVCADGDPVRGKPNPTLYLEALERLGLDADEAIAFEDSPNGIVAAQAAGLYCIAVPSEITRGAPGLEAADRTIGSLTELRASELIPSRSTPGRIRRHGRSLARSGRSPLYVALIAAAADDHEAGGVVARLFAGVDLPPGALPAGRLMAAVHELALTGREPELSAFYPSTGGTRPPDAAWRAVRAALERNFDWIKLRLHRTVQTNEPGRSAALYPVLLWLTAVHGRPLRLLEIGASAGLNLICDRYRYDVGELTLGDPGSPVRFEQPWHPAPAIDLAVAAAALRITHREGCDPNPLDPASPDDRRRLISYIWPDEHDRLTRLDAALAVAAPRPPMVVKARAIDWLPDALSRRRDGELTVVWHSVMRQYVDPGEWSALGTASDAAVAANSERPIVWAGMEPVSGGGGFEIMLRTGADQAATRVAACNDHGPPVVWELDADQPIG
jgi:HAD superfamily hydrolase (TIGR01509 family)